MTTLVILVVVVAILLGEPLFVVLGGLTFFCFALISPDVHTSLDLMPMIEKIRDLADNEVLLAIPFFVIAGAIMGKGQISSRLIDVAKALVGWMPGGLAVSTVLACAFFAAITGSSPATVIAIGTIMVPALLKDRYTENFSLGLVTTSGSLGILIPPSIPMIVYALVKTGGEAIDVGELFLAGVGPGIVICGMLIGFSILCGVRFGVRAQPFAWRTLRKACSDGKWALGLPFLILGGIYSGLFTPTEAAAVAVVYAYVVEAFIHQDLALKDLTDVLVESAALMGALLIIMVMAMAFNDFLVDQRVPDRTAEWLRMQDLGPVTFLLLVNLILLLAGGVMDVLSAIMILVPLLAPVAENLGIQPIHLAIVFVVNLQLGYMTPPIGLNLFVTSSLFNKPLGKVVRAVLPTLGIMAIATLLVTFVPTIQLGLVNVLRGQSFYEPFPSAEAAAKVEAPTSQPTSQPASQPHKKIRSLEDLTDDADDSIKGKGKGKGKIRSLEDLTDDADDAIKGKEKKKEGSQSPAPRRIRGLNELTDEADKEIREE